MNELGFTIIGFAMGYFWAFYRVDNTKYLSLNMRGFWRHAEAWRSRQKDGQHEP